jgi:hypothetical protein
MSLRVPVALGIPSFGICEESERLSLWHMVVGRVRLQGKAVPEAGLLLAVGEE